MCTGTCGDGLTWTLDTAGTLTVTGSGGISANAFAVNSRIVRAEIGAGVTGIGMGAFLKCANLEAVTLPAGLTTLGTAAFAYCEKLAAVTLPGTLESTGGGAFQGCTALAAVTILPAWRASTRAQRLRGAQGDHHPRQRHGHRRQCVLRLPRAAHGALLAARRKHGRPSKSASTTRSCALRAWTTMP